MPKAQNGGTFREIEGTKDTQGMGTGQVMEEGQEKNHRWT